MDKQTKTLLGNTAIGAWIMLVIAVILLSSWIIGNEWRIFATAVILGGMWVGAMVVAHWADKA